MGTQDSCDRYLPLAVNVVGLKCLVVGGGRVGARKALTLAEHGAAVTVVSPEISQELRELTEAGAVKWECDTYGAARLAGYALVVAATSDPALNLRIGLDAEGRNILACAVSSGRLSRVIFPASHVENDITISVHSNGRNCSRSRQVRDQIAETLRTKKSSKSQ